MGKWHVGFDGGWKESFRDRDDAIEWASEVAETGRTVDVAQRRAVRGWKLVAVFPESERARREEIWLAATIPWLGVFGPLGGGGGFGGGGGDGGGGC
jgi:hypothetical protein